MFECKRVDFAFAAVISEHKVLPSERQNKFLIKSGCLSAWSENIFVFYVRHREIITNRAFHLHWVNNNIKSRRKIKLANNFCRPFRSQTDAKHWDIKHLSGRARPPQLASPFMTRSRVRWKVADVSVEWELLRRHPERVRRANGDIKFN